MHCCFGNKLVDHISLFVESFLDCLTAFILVVGVGYLLPETDDLVVLLPFLSLMDLQSILQLLDCGLGLRKLRFEFRDASFSSGHGCE